MAGENEPVVEQPIVPEVAVIGEQPVVVAAPEAPAVVEQPAVEAPAEPAKPATVAETPSLLEEARGPDGKSAVVEGEKAAEEAKPAEGEKPKEEKSADKPAEAADAAKAEADKPKEEAAPVVEPLPKVDYKFELPENVTLPDERKTEMFGLLDGFRADPSNLQPLIDFHVAEVNRQAAHLEQQQHDVFNDTRKTWRDEIKADPEMGGSGFQTTTGAVARMRDLLVSQHPVGSPEYDRQAKEANEFFRITGAGDHPVMWRIMHNAARWLDEAKPLATDIAPAPTGRQPGSKRALMYNHPTSPNNKDSA
jgi:hypothetical protein